MCGVDLTRIDGIDVTTALAVISETGADMSRFPTAGHFASWLGVCPGTKITGGRVMSGNTKRCANRAAQALRLAAAALPTSHSALGAYFRRMCARMDKPKAITAAAHKPAASSTPCSLEARNIPTGDKIITRNAIANARSANSLRVLRRWA
jgi:transposase